MLRKGEGHIFIKSGTEQIRVPLDHVLYVESFGNYMQFVTSDKKIMSRLTMAEVETLLPATGFVRIHRCYIVARNKINKIEKGSAWIGQQELPIGKNYQQEVDRIISR